MAIDYKKATIEVNSAIQFFLEAVEQTDDFGEITGNTLILAFREFFASDWFAKGNVDNKRRFLNQYECLKHVLNEIGDIRRAMDGISYEQITVTVEPIN